MGNEKITLIGAGLAGPLMATYLAQHGYSVAIYESRPDMRKVDLSAGRSINLALSIRGINALKEVGVFGRIEPITIPMKGRMIHDLDGNIYLQPYGQKEDEVIYSVSRAQLNMDLITHAQETGKVDIHFEHTLNSADLQTNELEFGNKKVFFDKVIGCDGSSSALRQAIIEKSNANYEKKPLGHGYKELTIPPSASGDFQIETHALHIWPRGEYMLIALPNMDRSFTCTLFFPMTGLTSFATVQEEGEIIRLFQNQFPDAYDLMPTLVKDFQTNPTGHLGTVYCDPWHYEDKAILLGDAAHAVVPFFGQGMNASFQDCSVLNKLIVKYGGNWKDVFNYFTKSHVMNGHAIADMAIENYIEMRDLVNDPIYKKRRELELLLEDKFTERFIPRYSMVSFHQIPYAEVYRRGEIQFKLMNQYLSNELTETQLHEHIKKQLTPIR